MRCRGFSLVGLLIAVLLAALLVAASAQAYLAASAALRWQTASAQLDIDGHRALRILARELRMAGFFGGAEVHRIAVPTASPDCSPGDDWALRPRPLRVISADDSATLGGLACLPSATRAGGADLLVTRRVASTATWGPASAWRPGPARGRRWYLAAARDGAGAFRWQEGTAAPTVGAGRVSYWAFRLSVFYLRRYSVVRGDGVPTLCAHRLRGMSLRSECLAEGVEDMRFELALDSDGDGAPDRLVHDSLAAGVHRVTHVHVYLLMRSVDAPGTLSGPRSYRLGDTLVEAGADGHLRRVFSATVRLRNAHA